MAGDDDLNIKWRNRRTLVDYALRTGENRRHAHKKKVIIISYNNVKKDTRTPASRQRRDSFLTLVEQNGPIEK